MNPQFYIRNVELDEVKNEFISLTLEHTVTKETTKWEIGEPLMDFTMDNDLLIEGDKDAQVLVYTAKREDGSIKHTVKIFYKGNQENLLFRQQYTDKFYLN